MSHSDGNTAYLRKCIKNYLCPLALPCYVISQCFSRKNGPRLLSYCNALIEAVKKLVPKVPKFAELVIIILNRLYLALTFGGYISFNEEPFHFDGISLDVCGRDVDQQFLFL